MNVRRWLNHSRFVGLLLLAVWSAQAADEASSTPVPGQRVFVCAHSFHIFVAGPLAECAKAAGITGHVNAGTQMLGGSRVIQHWNLPDSQNKVKAALRAGEVDVLTVSPHRLIPDEGIDNFTKLGLQKNPKLRVYVQESWPAFDGALKPQEFKNEQHNATPLAPLRVGHREWEKSVEVQVTALNKEVGHECVFVIPAGEAVFLLREHIAAGKAPGLTKQTDLFRDPIGHATEPLQVLVSYCNFATIYRRSPVGLPVPPPLKNRPQAEELNALLQKLAWQAVTGNLLSGVRSMPNK